MVTSRPNIVWLFPDEWRHDAFGHAGNDVIHTPNIDALASRGAVFTGARCESPVCQSARASLLTATFPRDHGLDDNEHLPSTAGSFPAAGQPNFLHALRRAGYHTAEVGKMHFGRGSLGDGVKAWGFDEAWQEHDKYVLWRLDTPYTRRLERLGLLAAWAEHNSALLPWLPSVDGEMQPNPRYRDDADGGPDPVPEDEMLDVFIGEEACTFLRAYDRDEPFFLWVAPIGPHPPFDAAERHTAPYDAARIPLGDLRREPYPDNRWGRYLEWNLSHIGCGGWDERRWRAVGRQYYGLCTQVDAVVGRVVATLAETGLDRSTWIVLSSDHGELLGDHGLLSKRVFFGASVRVPLLLVPPVGAERPLRHQGLVQSFDAVGTVLDLAGCDWGPGDVPARSLLPVFDGDLCAREVVFSEIAGFAMAESASAKAIVHKETGELGALHDLRDDPGERVDLADDSDARRAQGELLDRLAAYVRGGAQ